MTRPARFDRLTGAATDGPHSVAATNSVVLALVVALLDLERRDTRGKVVTPMTRRRPA